MNLLPKTSQDFSKTDYWNTFFQKRGTKAFEWYGEYSELSEHLHKYMKLTDAILVTGCGNSTLSADLHDVGFKNMINVDISEVVIQQMINANKYKRPDMNFLQMDALNMTFEGDKFNVVLDKGTLDALMTDDSTESNERIDRYFSEIGRVLKLTGRYICVSLLQEHILRKVVKSLANENWMLKILRCHNAEKSEENKNAVVMPVFIIVATKFKKLPQLLLEICLYGEKSMRVNTHDEIIEAVRNAQNIAIITNGLSKQNLEESEEIRLDLMKPIDNVVRYTLYVLDQSSMKKNGPFAAFIVPQGRESEWMFSTKEGRKELLKSAGFGRLAIAILHRNQTYESQDSVKLELSECVRNLAPKGITGQIPYLSLGDDIGKREIIHRGTSEFSGDFIVEEVVGENNCLFRRLIFLNNQFVIQSESRLKSVKNRKGKKTQVIDYGYLSCSHHIYMTIGIQLAKIFSKEDRNTEVAIIGLGGGGLCSFLQKCFHKLKITAIDIDDEVFKIAQQYFGLQCDEALQVSIEDGINFLSRSETNGVKFDALLFDVDSKDSTLGISCPPVHFVDISILKTVSKCLNENGYFILNLVCRDEALKMKTLENLNSVFKYIASYKLEQEVNEIIFCTNKKSVKWSEDLRSACDKLNAQLKDNKLVKEPIVETEDFLKMLRLTGSK